MSFWSKIKFPRISGEDRAGLYITLIVHLSLIAVLLLVQIGFLAFKETSFILDFSAEEERERAEREIEFKEDISERIDGLIAAALSAPQGEVRNIAVDASQPLKDDRGTNAEELYKENERLQQELRGGQAIQEDEDRVALPSQKQDETTVVEYKGPSVVSYNLDGRKASTLKIPAYRCMGGGDVTVIITVDPQGNVVNAKILDSVSSTDSCLREFAIRAARLSKFTVLSQDRLKADKNLARQVGEIVYRFIPQ